MQRQSIDTEVVIPTDALEEIESILDSYRGEQKALIPVLTKVQEVAGYLPEVLQRKVAEALEVPISRVFGVVTFYSFFTMKPRGRHPIRLCLGTACHVRGADRNFKKLVQSLGITPGSVTPDFQFGLEVVRCLGACGLAPVMTIDKDTHRQVKETQVDTILNTYTDK